MTNKDRDAARRLLETAGVVVLDPTIQADRDRLRAVIEGVSPESARILAENAGFVVVDPNDFDTVNTLACALSPWIGKGVDYALSAAREVLLALKEIAATEAGEVQ